LLAKRADISFEHYMSIIEILGSIDTEASQKLLISFFYKGNKMIAQEVLRELRNFSQPDIDFLFMALEYDDYFIRKEAIGVLTALGRREVNERILKILFVPNDIFGTKDQALMRSIELVDELRMSEAALNLISILTQRRFMFGKRLDALRLRAALALVNIGTPEVIKAVADFSSDRFKALREYAQMIKRTNF